MGDQERQIVNRLEKLLGENISSPHHLELFATVWYLLPLRNAQPEEIISIIDTIVETKPRFNQEEVQNAIEQIIEFKRSHDL